PRGTAPRSRTGPTSASMSKTWRSSGVIALSLSLGNSDLAPTPTALGEGTLVRLRRCRRTQPTRLAYGVGGAHGEQAHVVEDGAELEALLEALVRRLGSVGVHAGDQPSLARLLQDDPHRLEHSLLARIEGRRLAHAERQVRRADVDPVQAF